MVTPGIKGVTAFSTWGLKIKAIKLMKTKNIANIEKANETKIPMFQKTRQDFGFFLANFFIKLFNFLVFSNAIIGKNT